MPEAFSQIPQTYQAHPHRTLTKTHLPAPTPAGFCNVYRGCLPPPVPQCPWFGDREPSNGFMEQLCFLPPVLMYSSGEYRAIGVREIMEGD